MSYLSRSRQFLLTQKRLRGCGLTPGGRRPCLGRSASSVYEDTSSLLLFGWRKTVEGSTKCTGLQNRRPYRQVLPIPAGITGRYLDQAEFGKSLAHTGRDILCTRSLGQIRRHVFRLEITPALERPARNWTHRYQIPMKHDPASRDIV